MGFSEDGTPMELAPGEGVTLALWNLDKEIKVQVRGAPRATGTDANAIQISREGVAAGLIGIPNRYMHSPVEMVALSDLNDTARLLAEFCANLPPDGDWTP